ncbi:MAG: hypothetical protein ACLTZT_20925, partial [Butyricimonas faecalis]
MQKGTKSCEYWEKHGVATENERANKRYTYSPGNRNQNNNKLHPVNENTPISFAEKLYFIMKENKYDDEIFFNQYSQMSRSVDGLKGAGEWHVLQKMLPDFQGKRVLDLGCGFGWHCRY